LQLRRAIWCVWLAPKHSSRANLSGADELIQHSSIRAWGKDSGQIRL